MARQIVSLGSFCLVSHLIDLVGVDQPSYPFDDMFTSARMVNDCLQDGFATFLDFADCEQVSDERGWVHRRYRAMFGEAQTIAHHDIREPEVQAAFRRRAARLLDLTEADNPLFVFMGWADRLDAGLFTEFRATIAARYGRSHAVMVALGPQPSLDRFAGLSLADTTIVLHSPSSDICGVEFTHHADNFFLIDAIKAAYAASALPDGQDDGATDALRVAAE